MPTTVQVRLFPAAINKVLSDRGGPVGIYMAEKAQAVANHSRQFVGSYFSGQHPGPSLRDAIKAVPISPSPSWAVVADHRIALAHHEGTKPHLIPVGIKGALYRSGGPVDSYGDDVFGPVFVAVRHAGTQANQFLIKGARAAGFSVDTSGRNRSTFTNKESFSGTIRT